MIKNFGRKALLGAFAASAIVLGGCETISTDNVATAKNKDTDNLSGSIIKYEKYELDNGLTVILHEDQSDPLVEVNITYHVGSAREELGRSGFAHFFEHMMFQGSENVDDEEHFKIVTEAGGTMNGSTNSDITNYYQTVPVNQLEKILWLESDRMGFLLDAVTQEKFENQRETVKNERGQRVDNQPYGLRFERTGEALYPVGHPYSWSTIGYVEDLDRVNVNDLKKFFQKWYGPNNAVLTIGGAIDKAQTKAWIEKYFGSIPRGPEVKKAPKAPATLDETRYITLEDKVHLPLLQITMPTVYAQHPDEAALDVLANILGGGKTSLLYKNMVQNGLALQAFAGHPCRELACEFQLLALVNPQKVQSLKQMQTIIDETLAEFETRGVQDDDLQRTKAGIESSTIFGLQSVAGKVRQLASGEIFYNEPDGIQADIERYNSVTKADVMRVYNQYVKNKPAVVLSIVPKGKAELAVAEQNFSLPERKFEESTASVDDIKQADIKDDFDRSVQPTAGVNPIVGIPDYWKHSFENGIDILGVDTDETPTVFINIAMEGGVLLDSVEKPGVATMTAQMMNESTALSSNVEMANRLALLGSSISFRSSGRYTNIYLSSLTKNLDETLVLLKEKLFSPGFKEDDFARLKQNTLQGLQQALKNPSTLASRARDIVLYGEDSILGMPSGGTTESVQAITLDDLKAYYDSYYRPNFVDMVIVGDLPKQQAVAAVSLLSAWEGKDYNLPKFGEFENAAKGKIYLVDNPGGVQSVISILKHALVFDAEGEYFKAGLMNFPLGGMFNSRINLNLREDKGYTYGARSGFSGGKVTGTFSAGADVAGQHTVASIQEFLKEMDTFRESGMTQDELELMKKAYTQRDALSSETPTRKAGILIRMLGYDLDKEYRERQKEIINNATVEELNALAKKWLDTDSMDIIVVGDAATLREKLEVLDREIVDLEVPK
ncbi:M16 family metallopeptidase [Glaciecola sp. MF2-115]|uniref:M16 family metallopeptidase n=1 Tax=Glaciecola sp. MF2-115 TaxID=3384827 RepID=UPI0039A0746B